MEDMKMAPQFSLTVAANETGYEAALGYGALQVGAMPDYGFTPQELLVSSTAACSGIVFGMIAKKMRLNVKAVSIKADATRNLDEAMRVESIHLHYTITGEGLSDAPIKQAIGLAFKNCPNVQTIKDSVRITESFEIIEG